MSTALVNGIRVAFDDVGPGEDVLVLIHGHPFNRSMWQSQVDAGSRAGWRVIAPDLRGYGETTVVGDTTSLELFARDIAALLDHLGVSRVVVAGLSMGGQIAMEFARLYRERLRGIVLAATYPQAETEQGKRNRHVAADRLLREGMSPYAEEVLTRMLASRSIAGLPSVATHVLTMMQTTNPHGAAAALRGRAERPPYEPVLATLDIPALVVVGDEDAFTTRADADRMHQLLTGSQLVWMKGVGHMPNLERAAEFNAALAQFLKTVAA